MHAPAPRLRPVALLAALGALSGCGGAPSGTDPGGDAPTLGAATPAPAAPSAPEPVAETPTPLPHGLAGYADPEGRYADAARAASLGYAGRTDAARLDRDTAGPFLATVLHGPLSTATTPGGLPLVEGDRGVEGALFPGYPVAILSRTGLGYPWAEPRSLGTRQFEASAREARKLSHQEPWWDVFARASGGRANCPGGGAVTWSANLLAGSPGGGDERGVTWERCRTPSDAGPALGGSSEPSEGVLLDGSARLHRADDGAHAIAWDGVEYAGNGRRWRVTGVESSPGPDGCGFDARRLSHLLIETLDGPLDGGEAVLLENFGTAIVGEPPDSRVCGASGLFANWFSGRMLRADRGAVEVATPAHLSFLSMSPTIGKDVETLAVDPEDPGTTTEGETVLRGADGAEIRLRPTTFRRFGGVHDAQYHEPVTAAFDIVVAPADRAPFVLRLPRAGAFRGTLADLADADADGMPNGWELAEGLDPLDPADGGSDADGDGRDAHAELVALTSPNGADPASADSDAGIGASLLRLDARDPATGALGLPAGTVLARVGGGDSDAALRRRGWRVTLRLVGDARFASATSYHAARGGGVTTYACEPGPDARTLACEWADDRYCHHGGCNEQGLLPKLIPVEPLGDTPIRLVATLEHGSADPDRANDVAEAVLEPPFDAP